MQCYTSMTSWEHITTAIPRKEGRVCLVGSARIRFRAVADHRALMPCLLSVVRRPWPVGSGISAGT